MAQRQNLARVEAILTAPEGVFEYAIFEIHNIGFGNGTCCHPYPRPSRTRLGIYVGRRLVDRRPVVMAQDSKAALVVAGAVLQVGCNKCTVSENIGIPGNPFKHLPELQRGGMRGGKPELNPSRRREGSTRAQP